MIESVDGFCTLQNAYDKRVNAFRFIAFFMRTVSQSYRGMFLLFLCAQERGRHAFITFPYAYFIGCRPHIASESLSFTFISLSLSALLPVMTALGVIFCAGDLRRRSSIWVFRDIFWLAVGRTHEANASNPFDSISFPMRTVSQSYCSMLILFLHTQELRRQGSMPLSCAMFYSLQATHSFSVLHFKVLSLLIRLPIMTATWLWF